jgi:hypothetical protein
MVEASELTQAALLPELPKKPNRVEHFWLCGICSIDLTVAYDRQSGMQVVPKARAPKKILHFSAS